MKSIGEYKMSRLFRERLINSSSRQFCCDWIISVVCVGPVEIKSGSTVTTDYIRTGQKAAHFAGDEALPPWLVHGGGDTHERSGVRVLGWRRLREILPSSFSDSSP
jgi:hypothetical protein